MAGDSDLFIDDGKIQEFLLNLAESMGLLESAYRLKLLAQRAPDNNSGLKAQLEDKRKKIVALYAGKDSVGFKLMQTRLQQLVARGTGIEIETPSRMLEKASHYVATVLALHVSDIEQEYPSEVDSAILAKSYGDYHGANAMNSMGHVKKRKGGVGKAVSNVDLPNDFANEDGK
jgi:hypothetical protein